MTLAPIVLFVYNRPWHTRQTLESLRLNFLASQSNLFIYADGPKANESKDHLENIIKVRETLREKNWCKNVTIIESKFNKGLAASIIDGVTEVLSKFDRIIVLEDDIVTSQGFLNYMNTALDIYENYHKVMHISAFMYPTKMELPETFFCTAPIPWGWGTWRRSWKSFINDEKYLYDYFEKHNKWMDFNVFGGSLLKDQLIQNINGQIKTWFIKWHASIFMCDGLTLMPNRSLVKNIGFDNSGIHCGYSLAFNTDYINEINVSIQKLCISRKAEQIIRNFYNTKTKSLKGCLINVLKLIPNNVVIFIQKIGYDCLKFFIPKLKGLNRDIDLNYFSDIRINCILSKKSKIYSPFHLNNTSIGDYSYISFNSRISLTTIGKFCSIGPNFICGWGIHPTDGLSTSPMFYSASKQTGFTFSERNKICERKDILIGNDVYIGGNVMVLDGVKIGDGAVIGAGSVVSKDIPPYAVAVGAPIKIIRYRFSDEQISKLLKIAWWEFEEEKLKDVENLFWETDDFIDKYDK